MIDIAAGSNHTCVRRRDGRVQCWGAGASGQLGYGHSSNIGDDETPTVAGDVLLGGAATAITAGAAHTCALFESGQVMCWGSAVNGQLGHGSQENIGDNETPASAGFVPIN